MNSPEIKRFIHKNSNLLWYIPDDKKEDISHELLLETILNYGTLDDVKELFKIMGINQAAMIFSGLQGRKKKNYYPEIYNFFSLYFKKYASGNIESRTK
jgi:hypothetical protein